MIERPRVAKLEEFSEVSGESKRQINSGAIKWRRPYKTLGIVCLAQYHINLAAVVIPSPLTVGEESRAYVLAKPDRP